MKNEDSESASKLPNKETNNNYGILFLFGAIVILLLILSISIVLLLLLFIYLPSNTTIIETSQTNSLVNIDHTEFIPSLDSRNKSIDSQQQYKADLKTLTIEYIVWPQNVSVTLGADIIIRCSFSQPVACSWKRNSKEVSIRDRYSFIKPRIDGSNEDCSIAISNVQSVDFGTWTCSVKASDSHGNNGQMLSADAQINEIKPPPPPSTAPPNNSNEVYKLGSNITLGCVFDKASNCAWLRNDHEVAIAGRYFFKNNGGKNTKTCSIGITGLTEYDAGNWTCTQLADSSTYDNPIEKPIILKIIK